MAYDKAVNNELDPEEVPQVFLRGSWETVKDTNRSLSL